MASAASWTSFLKSITSYNGDLASLTAPPFILSPVSLVEYSQYWAEHPNLLLAPNFISNNPKTQSDNDDDDNDDDDDYEADEDNIDVKKILAVTKWFIATLKSQYCSRNESMGSEKKPLNPFLGELFTGKWSSVSKDPKDSKDLGETILLSEQVSHHPPITAYAIINEKHNTTLQGYNRIKASIYTYTLSVKQFGHAILQYKNSNDSYLITLPGLHIEGLLAASPFVELDGKSYIQSSSGYLSAIEYSGRGYFSGKKNTFKAKIIKNNEAKINLKKKSPEKILYTIQGQWSEKSYISKYNSSAKKLFYDANLIKPEILSVKPIEAQHPLESRKAWLDVAEAIKSGDYDLIHNKKSKLENDQRELRKIEIENNTPWKNRWFTEIDLSGKELPALGQKSDPFTTLSTLANLSKNDVPSGTPIGDKEDDPNAHSKHWRLNIDAYKNESEITPPKN
ncbi:oxysterol-binding protein KES1 [Ascoidea rubescens DSM 1968]|uniref:Oxysterol-binding protein n=1 Tax=Ascoidea rubescens DSM 1968 TaxID=1344418 RepID=A0A1D2VF88_9ASCO|nr:Oxysterol-binding protein [Ascoidea rubescens DSM 1968]ODV60137.1 Oxysterol-binding protein [Ascoidea rubescens DSM 1968]